MAEKVLLHYEHEKTYTITENNAIGATTSTTSRTIPTVSGNTFHVKKFGTNYAINDITNCVISSPKSDGGGLNKWWYEFYNENDTLLGTVKDENHTSTFVDGAAEASTRIYIKLVWKSGTVSIIDGNTIQLTTNIDSLLWVFLSGESITSGELLWSLSASGSTYYMDDTSDIKMMYGGSRPTPYIDGTEKYPYFDISEACVQCGPNDGVQIDDSCYYNEKISFSNHTIAIFAKLGETPHIIGATGATIYTEVSLQYNNYTAIYFNENGDDANNGTWQYPKLTITNAMTNRNTKNVIYGGTGATAENGIFEEQVVLDAGMEFIFESDYGYVCKIYKSGGNAITLADADNTVYGMEIYECANGISFSAHTANRVHIIKYCTFRNISNYPIIKSLNFREDTFTFSNNLFYNNGIPIFLYTNNSGSIICNIKKNIFYANKNVCIRIDIDFSVLALHIENNLFYKNTAMANERYSILCLVAWGGPCSLCGNITNNTLYQGLWGFSSWSEGGGYFVDNGFVMGQNIYREFGTAMVSAAIAITSNYDCCYDNENDTGVGVTMNNKIAADPKFCSITDSKYGLSAKSPCLKANGSEGDVGVILNNALVNQNNLTYNGLIFDGNNNYNNGIGMTGGADYTGLKIHWCTFLNYQGISEDIYSGTDTNAEIKNCIAINNGNGIKLSRGGNIIQECLIYNNTKYGIHSDWTGQIFNHNVFYNNYHGLYLESNSSGIIYKNNISHGNSLYGIYSEVSLIVTYSCIMDAINANVDITDSSNIINNPLFVDLTSGSENLNIKTIGLGYTFNSPCVEKSDTGNDIGAYDVTYAINNEYWRKYQLEYNPANLNLDVIAKGERRSSDGLGSISLWTKSHKRQLPMSWDSGNYTSEKQRKILEYMSTLIPSRENNLTKDGSLFRIALLPVSYLDIGTGATVDSAAKTITKADMNLVSNEFKGFWAGVKYDTGTGAVISASGKTLTDAGASWAVDEWVGYFIYYAQNYYYIKSNTATVLTLSDALGTLTDKTGYVYSIEKYFKIISNTKTVFTVEDTDDELISGSYDWYINFIVCKLQRSRFGYKQPGYNYKYEHMKTGYKIAFEEE